MPLDDARGILCAMWRVALLAIAGCASIDSAPGLVTPAITVTNDPVVVSGPALELDFSATGTHMPDHLKSSDGTELLGSDDPCTGSSQIGFAVSPAVSAVAGMTGTGVQSTVSVVESGPVLAKVHVAFAVNYACPNAETLQGTSDFTIFPSGRIVREDLNVQPSTDTLEKTGTCGCQQESDAANFKNFYFGTFYAFDPTGATQVQADGTAVPDGVFAACTMYAQRAVAVQFDQFQSGVSTRYHAQKTASHAYDWASDQTELAPAQQGTTSAIFVSNKAPASLAECGGLIGRLADVPLAIGTETPAKTGHDGVYRAITPHPEPFVIKPVTDNIPPGFAIAVDLGGADHATIVRSPDLGTPPAMVQREQGTTFLIYFPDGLAPGETITITPTS